MYLLELITKKHRYATSRSNPLAAGLQIHCQILFQILFQSRLSKSLGNNDQGLTTSISEGLLFGFYDTCGWILKRLQLERRVFSSHALCICSLAAKHGISAVTWK